MSKKTIKVKIPDEQAARLADEIYLYLCGFSGKVLNPKLKEHFAVIIKESE